MNLVFANRNEENLIHPLATRDIVQRHKADKEGVSTQLVKNIKVHCKGDNMVIP